MQRSPEHSTQPGDEGQKVFISTCLGLSEEEEEDCLEELTVVVVVWG